MVDSSILFMKMMASSPDMLLPMANPAVCLYVVALNWK